MRQLLSIFVVSLSAAMCQGLVGDYTIKILDRNTFSVYGQLNRHSHDVSKLKERVLFKAAETTLSRGYAYFRFAYSEESQILSNHTSTNVVVTYRYKPTHFNEETVYDANDTFVRLVKKLRLHKNGVPKVPPQGTYVPDVNDIEFTPTVCANPDVACPNSFVVIWPSTDYMTWHRQEGILVGVFGDVENPYDSVREFAEIVEPIAKEEGANVLVVEDDPNLIKENEWLFGGFSKDPNYAFVSYLCVLPQASLGIVWEPGDLLINKHIVRDVRPESNALDAGLLLGDKVLEADGVDLLDRHRLVRLLLRKRVGDEVTLLIAREGEPVLIPIELVRAL